MKSKKREIHFEENVTGKKVTITLLMHPKMNSMPYSLRMVHCLSDGIIYCSLDRWQGFARCTTSSQQMDYLHKHVHTLEGAWMPGIYGARFNKVKLLADAEA
jgi:hypothetical protein